jgi:hypothetical protein
MTTAFDYGFFSADSHVTEPPDCYARFIDPAYRDRAPHIVRDEKRGDLYIIPGLDKMSVPMGLVAAAGDVGAKAITYLLASLPGGALHGSTEG